MGEELQEFDGYKGVWRTVGGRRIFIRNGEGLSSAMKRSGKFTKSKKSDIIEGAKNIGKLKDEDVSRNVKKGIKDIDNKKYDDGTYDINTKKLVSFNEGYQATFQQLGDKYTDKEFGALVKKYSSMTDGKVYAGKFGGSPEVSFHFKNEKDAIEICEKYNQVSYWDWKTMSEIKNKKYKKGKGNDYA